MVSIITPVFNAQEFISDCINSVLSQTYKNWEHILVDDGSTDSSADVIEQFAQKDKRIKYYKLKKNSGAGVARNKAIAMAKGRYIAFLDSDDFWHSQKLEKQIAVLESGPYSIVYSKYYAIDEGGDILYKINSPREVHHKKMLKNDYVGFLTLIYDTEKLGKIYMPTIRKRQDWAYKLRLMKEGEKAIGIQEPLAYYRVRTTSLSSNKLSLLPYNFAVYRKELGFSWSKSIASIMLFLYHNLHFKLTSRERKR